MKFSIDAVKALPAKACVKAKTVAPEALLVAGIGGIIFATVKACQATPKAEEVLSEFEEAKAKCKSVMDDAHKEAREEVGYTEFAYRKEMAGIYAKAGVKLLRVYAVPLAVGALSITSILASHGLMRKRVAGLTAAYTALDGAFRRYRERVVEEYGEEVDKRFKSGVKEKEIVVGYQEDKNGSKKEIKEKVKTLDGTDDPSEYGRWFDEFNSTQFEKKDPVYNLAFLKAQETYFNNVLNARGHVFLNEIYDALGFERTSAGSVVGWIKGNGDGFIDFGIIDHTYRQCDEYNANENSTLAYTKVDGFYLDFNVDGVIWDKI